MGALGACQGAGPEPGDRGARAGDEIAIGGKLFHAGTPVVLWDDENGYDAYREDLFFPDEPPQEGETLPDRGRRYGERSGSGALADTIDLFVIHYDASGTSRQCFKTLQDRRGLSVHFLLDLDGTIYQTLDVKERAWHAGAVNDRSIGIEIANPGAYAERDNDRLKSWYARDAGGTRVTFPPKLGPPGIRTEGFVPRPARDEIVSGKIHGETFWQYDFTNEQYAALALLTRAVSSVLPRIRLDAPRDRRGRVRTDALSEKEIARYSGLVGHLHVTAEKIDPGPAFDWERLLREAR